MAQRSRFGLTLFRGSGLPPVDIRGSDSLRPATHPLATVATLATVSNANVRVAIAIAGGVPVAYVRAFAAMRTGRPPGVPDPRWRQAINDAGLFLDQWGRRPSGSAGRAGGP